MDMRLPNFPAYVPWFIFDIDNVQLITSPIIPGDISDTKEIVYAEIQIPGLRGQPMQSGGMGNRKVSFTIQVINRDDIVGNISILKQFESLRVPSFSFLNVVQGSSQFRANPRVLYYWGTGSIPLVWYVTNCSFTHKQGFVNSFGVPKYTDVSIELTLDEFNVLNKAEDIFRSLTAVTGNAFGVNAALNAQTGKRPY